MAAKKKKPITKIEKAGTNILIPTPVLRPEDINDESLRYLSKDNFAMWAVHKGVEVDNKKLQFDDYKFLLPIYMDPHKEIVLVKAAQLGATVYQILRILWFLEQHQGTKAGLYFPNKELADNTSKDRVAPMLQSCPDLADMSDPNDKLGLRKLGKSSMYMMYLEGKSSKDSVPLDYLSFDEVRLSSQQSIDQTQERIAGSRHKYKVFMSTCFAGDTEVIVRKRPPKYAKVPSAPTTMDMVTLSTCWEDYQALSFDNLSRGYTFKDITEHHSNGVQEVTRVLFDDGSEAVCTPDHEFAWSDPLPGTKTKHVRYVPIKDVFGSRKDYRRTYQYNNLLSLSNLDQISKKECDAPYDSLMMYIMGAYVSEGCFLTDTVIRIAQTEGRPIWIKSIEWAQRNNLTYSTGPTYINISLCTRPDLLDLFKQTGAKSYYKRIPDSFVAASVDQLRTFIDGYIEGDGTFRTKDRWEATTTSKVLAKQLQFVALRTGAPAFIRERPLESGQTKYEVSCSPLGYRLYGRDGKQVYNAQFRLGKVISVTPQEIPVPVYDITVADNHNYVLSNGFVAHNCGLPQDTIHKRFLRGTQHIWMVKCNCPDGCDLARTFPNCVVDDPKRGLYLRCPRCKYIIKDNQNGRYVPHNPEADVHSYSVSQLNSKFITLKEIWEFYKTTTNIAEFYNGKLGLPWVDEENRGVSMDQLEASVDDTVPWGRIKGSKGCAMGVDQGAGYVMVIIGDLADNGKKRIRHVEIIENSNPAYMVNGERVTPWGRLYELMREYDVRICVVDAMPDSNGAMSFAQAFKSRVFMAYFARDAKHVVQWGDKKKSNEATRKAGGLNFKYIVTLSKYMSLGAMYGAWGSGDYVCPNPDKLVQICRSEETNQLMPEAPMRRVFNHMCRHVKQFTVTNEETGEGRHEWIYSGGDPHLALAMDYLNVGLERLGKRVIWTFA